MNAIQVLRTMHADTKVRFKLILGADDPAAAEQQWQELQPLLELHEQIEDRFLYTPLFEELGVGNPLGGWELQHNADVAIVQQLVEAANQVDAGSPEWRTLVGRVMDALSKHVMDEEGQIFGRIEEIWDAQRLDEAGAQIEKLIGQAPAAPTASVAARRKR
jgi:hypothetical protein